MRSFEGEGAGASPSYCDEDIRAGRQGWTAIVLAGSRAGKDPLAAQFELPLKALVPVAGAPMIEHVVRSLARCPSVARILIVAQRPELLDCPDLRRLSDRCPIDWAAGKEGIAESVMMLGGTEAAPWPLLVTTADHPLLTPDMVEHFLARSGATDASLAVVDRALFSARFPQNRRTWLRFRAGAYTGANLFAVRTPDSIQGLKILARAEASRKNQLKLLWHFGPLLAVGALARALTLDQVVKRAEKRLKCSLSTIILPFAEAGIDVDSWEDWRYADGLLSGGSPKRPAAAALPIAAFDLDRTLTRRGTYTAFLLYAAARRAPWRLLLAPLAALNFLAYLCRAMSRKRLKERLQALFLGPKMPRADVARLADRFVRHIHFHEDAVRRLESERKEGRRIVLATAANAFYVDAIAHRLGIEHVVCTQSKWEGDHLTPRIDGENCHGPAKLAMLQSHFREEGIDRQSLHVRFFSDHPSDRPVFCWADEAYVVNPPRSFRSRAAAAGWTILKWT